MLKLLGIILILSTCVLYGQQMKMRLQEHVNQLIGLKEMLLMLSGEISYTKTPLGEAFARISRQGKEPFSSFLNEVAGEMEKGSGKAFSEIWHEQLKKHKQNFLFQQEEWKIFEEVGTNFGYLDVKMQLCNLEHYLQQTEQKIEQAQKELANKQKLWQYLSMMGGIFLILVLL